MQHDTSGKQNFKVTAILEIAWVTTTHLWGGWGGRRDQKKLTAIATHFLALFAKSTPIVLPSIFNGG